ncbi:hypothetical protein BGZ67_003732 [Mortierella alpina]|nr:hypothetical protein BGZ67_003732 [Mortierella alpina]
MKLSALLSCSLLCLSSVVLAQTAGNGTTILKCIKPGIVALTFDDGPGQFNDQLLALLKKKNVAATFFVLGSMIDQDAAQAASLKKMLDAGHQLASHTYTHRVLDTLTEDEMKLEMKNTSDAIFKHAAVRPYYMRAPQGECAAKCLQVMTDLGYIVTRWNVDTNDWRHATLPPAQATNASMAEINDLIVAKSDPKVDSFIILEHEIHKFSVDFVAELVIDAVLKKGYKFVTVEECVGKPAYREGSTIPPKASGSATGTGSGPKPSGNSTNDAVALLASAWTLAASALITYTLL